ncbi:MAG: aldolase [Actinomycetota bacterium]|nr:aldolase [Actinomycetota bacterium]
MSVDPGTRPLQIDDLPGVRLRTPQRVQQAAAARRRPDSLLGASGRLLLVAADHPARGALRAGDRAFAMADRPQLLDRLCTALSRPGVDGVLGTADVVDDLMLLGALEGKVVLGSMNRGGLAGTAFEIDDRFTGYSAAAIATAGLQGGKMLLRIDPADPSTSPTLQSCAEAVDALAARELLALIEPFICESVDGRVRNILTAEAAVRSATVAAGLGGTSAYTWLKLPVVPEMEQVLSATTLPVVLLGGEVVVDSAAQRDTWRKALAYPSAVGLVVGRSLLYPPDGDVAAAVDATVELMT